MLKESSAEFSRVLAAEELTFLKPISYVDLLTIRNSFICCGGG